MPPSSPILSSQPPPPPEAKWRFMSAPDHTDKAHQLQAAQAQAAQLRALYAALLSNAKSPWKAKISDTSEGCLSPSATVCSIGSGHNYPIFTPLNEDFVIGGTIQVENMRNSMDHREGSQDGRSSRILDDYRRTSSAHGSDIFSSVLGPEESWQEESPPSVMGVAEAREKGSPIVMGNNLFNLASVSYPYTTHDLNASGDSLFQLGVSTVQPRPHNITSVHPVKDFSGRKVRSRAEVAEAIVPDTKSRKNTLINELLAEVARKKALNEAAMEAPRGKPYMGDVAIADGGLTCDRCKPGVIVGNSVVPLTDSRDFGDIRARKNQNLGGSPGINPFKSLFSRLKKKNPSLTGTTRSIGSKESGRTKLDGSEAGKDLEVSMAMDVMKLKVSQARRHRDAALVEVSELRAAMEEMGRKLEHVEKYCLGLKHALDQRHKCKYSSEWEVSESVDTEDENLGATLPSGGYDDDDRMEPTRSEFFHAVTEARVGVKQLCRALVEYMQETDKEAMAKLAAILVAQPSEHHKTARLTGRVSRSMRYYLEALINHAFYEHFENVNFERGGSYPLTDPKSRAAEFYDEYVQHAKLSYVDLLRKESVAYCRRFDGFCGEKMGRVEAALGLGLSWAAEGWPDEAARSFFVAARCVWLLHKLAFACRHPAAVFRVSGGAVFDARFMEHLPADSVAAPGAAPPAERRRIRAMVMPGFFLRNNDVVKCKVLCWHE